eukprot:Pgem_evm1s2420
MKKKNENYTGVHYQHCPSIDSEDESDVGLKEYNDYLNSQRQKKAGRDSLKKNPWSACLVSVLLLTIAVLVVMVFKLSNPTLSSTNPHVINLHDSDVDPYDECLRSTIPHDGSVYNYLNCDFHTSYDQSVKSVVASF